MALDPNKESDNEDRSFIKLNKLGLINMQKAAGPYKIKLMSLILNSI
jgi:hypothetical protein